MEIGHIGVLANPGSTRMVHGIAQFRDTIASHPGLHYRELTGIEDVTAILHEFSELGVRLLFISGGDGTIQAVGTALALHQPFEEPPVLAILPGGRTNMTAHALGLSDTPEELLPELIDAALEDRLDTVEMPFLKMHIAADREPVLGIFFGAATIVRGIQLCRRAVYPLGLPNGISHFLAISYLCLLTAWPFKTRNSPLRSEPTSVKFGSSPSESRSYLILLVTTLDRLLLGISTTAPVGEGPLRFTSIDYSFFALLRAVWTFLFGRPTSKLVRGLVRRKAVTVEVLTDSPVTLDGEFFDPVPGEPVVLEATEPFTFVRVKPSA